MTPTQTGQVFRIGPYHVMALLRYCGTVSFVILCRTRSGRPSVCHTYDMNPGPDFRPPKGWDTIAEWQKARGTLPETRDQWVQDTGTDSEYIPDLLDLLEPL